MLEYCIHIPPPVLLYGFKGLPIVIHYPTVVAVAGSAIGIAVLAAFVPAWRAGSLAIVEALRYE